MQKKPFSAAIIVLLVISVFYGCSSKDNNCPTDTIQTETETTNEHMTDTARITVAKMETGLDNDKSLEVLEKFFGAETKHIIGRYSSQYYTGEQSAPAGFELWVKGGKFRLDEYKDDKKYRTMYSDNGVAKNYMYDTGSTTDSIMPLDYFINLFVQDISLIESLGSDKYGKALQFRFKVDSFYKNETAQSGYYVTEIIYLADSTKVRTHIVYGKESNGERPEEITIVTQTLDFVEIGIDLQDSIFEPPF